MTDENLRRVHVRITGRVQGVAYRYSTCARARDLGLVGWVRNDADGSVEATFEGPSDDVETMLAWCRRGPPLARVTGIQSSDEPVRGDSDEFETRY